MKKDGFRCYQLFFVCSAMAVFFTFSCERIRHTRQQWKEKTNRMIDRVAPRFDAFQPDTPCNRERFKEFLQVDATKDVQHIYCFNDDIGIDADYQFAFQCDHATVRRIIEKHQLTVNKEVVDPAFGLQSDFNWWDKKKIAALKLYSWSDDGQYFKYFWYDESEHQAYYFEFDL